MMAPPPCKMSPGDFVWTGPPGNFGGSQLWSDKTHSAWQLPGGWQSFPGGTKNYPMIIIDDTMVQLPLFRMPQSNREPLWSDREPLTIPDPPPDNFSKRKTRQYRWNKNQLQLWGWQVWSDLRTSNALRMVSDAGVVAEEDSPPGCAPTCRNLSQWTEHLC